MGEQDLLHQRKLVVGKAHTMRLDHAHFFQTCAKIETFMHFGIYSIHLKKLAES